MKIPHPIEAVIFDLDGTLVNTESVHCQAWLDVLAARGFIYDEHWFEQWIGTQDRILAQGVIDEQGLVGIKPRDLQKEKEVLFHQMVVQQNQAFSGILEHLEQLHTLLPLAIATNSGRSDAQHVFKSTPLSQYMQVIVTADDVKELKPAPEMYLQAATKLGVNPAHCLVLEDSPAGSTGGYKAGMYVIGLTSSQPKERMINVHEWHPTPLAGIERILALASADR